MSDAHDHEQLYLPDSDLGDADRDFAQAIRKFATEKLAPFAREVDEQRIFRREMVDDLGRAGILGGPLPAEAGGGGWTPLQLAIAHEELGAACSNARGFCAVQTGLVTQCLHHNGDRAQRERWLSPLMSGEAIGAFGLTEPEAGSDVASLQTRAERQPDGSYRISGSKHWITNGGVADVLLVFATVDPDLGAKGLTGFLLTTEREGIQRTPMPGVDLGHRGSDHAVIELRDVVAKESEVVGEIGAGFRIAMNGLAAGRLSVAAGAVGIHRRAVAETTKFARARRQFGKPISQFQMVQERLADMLTGLHASRGLVHRCARRRTAGRETHADLAMAKLYSTEAAAAAADQAVMLHGGRGYTSAYPAERLWRDVQALRIYEGTSMIQKSIIGRMLGD